MEFYWGQEERLVEVLLSSILRDAILFIPKRPSQAWFVEMKSHGLKLSYCASGPKELTLWGMRFWVKRMGRENVFIKLVLCGRHRTRLSFDTLALNLNTSIQIPWKMSLKAVESLSKVSSRKRFSGTQNHVWAFPMIPFLFLIPTTLTGPHRTCFVGAKKWGTQNGNLGH